MPPLDALLTAIICIGAVVLLCILFEEIAKKVFALLLNSMVGVLLLLILNKTPVALAINLPSVVTAFVLGVPGVAALLLLKFIFKI